MNITQRKTHRRNVRVTLGTTRDPAPGTEQVLRAARELASLLSGTSGGRYGLAVRDFAAGPDQFIPIDRAMDRERESAEELRQLRERWRETDG